MNINTYLKEMEYALSGVIDSLWHEHSIAEGLQTEIDALIKSAEDQYRRAERIAQDAETADDVMLATGMRWDAYFGDDKEAASKSEELAELKERLKLRAFSLSSLAGSLLQFAKQGLSAAYGEPKQWPPGRMVGRQPLSTVILQARNQAEHWEEGDPREPVVECFEALATEFGPHFAEYRTRNLAFEVVSLLGWRSISAFDADLRVEGQ